MMKIGFDRAAQHCFSSIAGNLSGPAAAEGEISPIALAISSSVNFTSRRGGLVIGSSLSEKIVSGVSNFYFWDTKYTTVLF